ncbi:MAG: exodeoxyribonuclease III [Erysipelotrichaceae bacterium]
MKIVTWNVNGLRACLKKGFRDYFEESDADVFCVQETKMQPDQVNFKFAGYHEYYNSAVKKGYSSTALYSKEKPIKVIEDIGIEEHDQEGRVITAEFEKCYVVCCYTPNSKDGLLRLPYRQVWEDDFRAYLLSLDKPVILCGDLNVAHNEIDLKNDKTNHKNPGFSDQEREKFTALLASGFTDVFRYLYPQAVEYSWWSYRANARANNAGWRIDYFVISDSLKEYVRECTIRQDIFGSDHCPVELEIAL